MSTVYDTTPVAPPPAEEEPSDPLEGVGTLTQQAQRDEGKKKPKTKFELTTERIQGAEAASKALKDAARIYGKSMTDSLADVESFARLIDDREITFEQLSASFKKEVL